MATFLRKNAPSWPPFKGSYKRIEDDASLLRSRVDGLSANTPSTAPSPYVPSPYPYKSPDVQESHGRKFRVRGWKGGARISFYVVLAVLIINSLLMIICTTALEWMDGMTMIAIGSCEKTDSINTWIHLAVNTLSTAVLASSNYCMQLLCAPTREDIDVAHARGHWLDIGIPSIRNLRSLKKKKTALWLLLATSSIPLHLFYNSVFFSAIATNDYNVLYVTEDFVEGAAYDKTRFPDTKNLNVTDLQRRVHTFDHLDREDCIKTYAQDFVPGHKHVILVTTTNSSTSSLQKVTTNQMPSTGFDPKYNAFGWICDDPLTANKTDACCPNKWGFIPCFKMTTKLEGIADQWWRSGGYDIDYCLAEEVEPQCHEHFSPAVMGPVLLFNIIKTIVIWYVAFSFQDKPLVTVGDAVDSFITNPDPTTQGMCLASQEVIHKHWSRGHIMQPIRYYEKRRRWTGAVSGRQWTALGFVWSMAGIILITGVTYGIWNLYPATLENAWSLGIGTVRQQNLITSLRIPSLGANAVFISALIANVPQAIFSFIYIIYSTIFSTMFLSQEWDNFNANARGRILRSSSPKSQQRSTYFLQVPYRYALVMLICSGLSHWLVSQSIFLANIMILPLDGVVPLKDEITTCAYSPKAMIFLLCLALAMLMWLFGNGRRRYSGRMALVGSCSAAISAACHVTNKTKHEREQMVLRPLRWGVTDFGNKDHKSVSGLGFSESAYSTPELGYRFEDAPDSNTDDYHFNKPTVGTTIKMETLISPPPTGKTPQVGIGRFREMEDRYGDVDERIERAIAAEDTLESDGQVGHCTFSDELQVGRLVEGRFYA